MKLLSNLYKSIASDFDIETQEVNFIQDKLFLYGKGTLDVTKLFEKVPENRIKHIISMYYMGLLLYKNSSTVKASMDKFILKRWLFPTDDKSIEEKFEFLWMLTAFYHDVGYAYENEQVTCSSMIKQMSNYAYPFRGNYSYIPKCYDNELLNAYTWYRYITSGRCDHGIAGAQKFYDDICKADSYGRLKLPRVYRAVCLCIACHNVWFPDNDTVGIYKAFGLGKLVDEFQKAVEGKVRIICIEEHPLLFLLSLADNLEPCKRTGSLAVLNSIRMDISEDSITVSTINKNCNQSYMNSISQLDKWLTDVEYKRTNEIVVKLLTSN